MIESRAQIEEAAARLDAVRNEIGRVIVGQQTVVEQLLWSLVAGGHALLEGIPGLGKTKLVRTVADVLDLSFTRIQFTPDLMPSDITGTRIVEFGAAGEPAAFRFQPGPVFGNLVLADEINRATPKTQSALLEAMQERTVTAGGKTHPLPDPFFVLATQNPIEQEGTYPLPEAQLDRFLLKIDVQFPGRDELKKIVARTTSPEDAKASKIAGTEDLFKLQRYAKEVLVSEDMLELAVQIVMLTHPGESDAPAGIKRYIRYGAGPRGVQSLVSVAKVRALLDGRLHISRADLAAAAMPVLRHRLVLGYEGHAAGIRPDDLVAEAVEAAGAPL